ncbi:Threonine dehydratase, partial [Pseudomonas savastanoi pv. glycinea]|uniref:pyridoxal-phosphate dependent enzyme n=1 Tax=Pseudomonas savastanoi TaxID=29438 RepID=UPI000EFE999B
VYTLLACRFFKCPAYIFVPLTTPLIKIDTIKRLGATVFQTGADFEACKLIALEYSVKKASTFVHPYDDIQVILGQATVGMEVLSQIPNLGYLFVPIGGGGLAAGISSYMKACAPQVKVIGVEPKGAAGMQHSLAEGAASAIPNVNTICDGVAVRLVGELCYEMCNQNLDSVITVDDADVYATICEVHRKLRSLPEPSGALALAGARKYLQQYDVRNSISVSVMTVANMDLAKLVGLSQLYSDPVVPHVRVAGRGEASPLQYHHAQEVGG